MTLFPTGPTRLDMPSFITCLLEALQEEPFRCSEPIGQNIWRLLEIWQHLNFNVLNHDPEHDLMRRGQVYERREEAAALSHRAFVSVFRDANFKETKDQALRATLCEAMGVECPVAVSFEEKEKGKEFFRRWYAEAKALSRTAT